MKSNRDGNLSLFASPRSEKLLQGFYVLVCIAEAWAMAYQTKVLGYGVDALAKGQNAKTFVFIFIGISLVILILETFGQLANAYYQRILTNRLRATIIGCELRKNRPYLSADVMGEIISLLNVNIPVLVKEFYNARLQMIVNAAMGIIYFLVLFSLPLPYVFTIAVVTFLTVLIPHFFKTKIANRRLKSLEYQEKYNASVRDSLAGFTAARLALGLGWLERKALETSKDQTQAEFAYQRMVVASNITVGSANFISKIAVFMCGVILVGWQISTIGEFITVFTMLSLVISPIVVTARQLSFYQGGKATKKDLQARCAVSAKAMTAFPSFDKSAVREPVDSFEWTDLEIQIPESAGVVKVDKAQLKPGDRLRVIGDNGAGKSTLLRCLVAFMYPKSGTVKVNGQNILQLKEEDLLSIIQYVPQDTKVFKGTVYENVNLDRGFSPEEVHTVLEKVGLVVELERVIDESSVSGGEKQRVALARALIVQPEVLILDEALSQVDLSSREQLLRAFRKDENLTLIYVSHLENIEAEDTVVRVRKIQKPQQ